MALKVIESLNSADSFNEGDLLLVRKSGMGEDKKITFADFIKSIGNSAIEGYIATLDEDHENKIVLRAVNNAPVYKYYDGMKISFVSPLQSNDVQIRIGNLSYKNLFKFTNDTGIALRQGDYIEAVMIGEHFRQVNDLKDASNVYTNDYVVTSSEIASNNLSTVLTLKSAYGLSKTEYYNGMSILFTCPIDTKGAVKVNVDGLGLMNLKEGVVNGPPLDFKKGQAIYAMYNDGEFIFNKFFGVDSKPSVQIVESALATKASWQASIASVAQPVVSIVQNQTIEVDPQGPVKTITEAIDKLTQLFGPNGENKKYTILLKPNFEWSETVTIYQGQKLDWITIKSNEEIIVPISSDNNGKSLKILLNATAPNLEVKIFFQNFFGCFLQLLGGTIHFNNCIFRIARSCRNSFLEVASESKLLINNSKFNFITEGHPPFIHPTLETFSAPYMRRGTSTLQPAEIYINNSEIIALDAKASLIDNACFNYNLSVTDSKIIWDFNGCSVSLGYKATFKNTSISNQKNAAVGVSCTAVISPQSYEAVTFENCTLHSGHDCCVILVYIGSCKILGSSVSNAKSTGIIHIYDKGRLIKDSKAKLLGNVAVNTAAGGQLITI